jgi:hypothetical protein
MKLSIFYFIDCIVLFPILTAPVCHLGYLYGILLLFTTLVSTFHNCSNTLIYARITRIIFYYYIYLLSCNWALARWQ